MGEVWLASVAAGREEVKEAWGWGSRSRRRRGFFKLVVAQVVQAVVVVWRAGGGGGGVSRGGTRRTGGEGGGTVLGDSSVVATQARRAHQEKASTVGSRESSLSHINLVIRINTARAAGLAAPARAHQSIRSVLHQQTIDIRADRVKIMLM